MGELYDQLAVMRQRIAELYQNIDAAPAEQIDRLATAFLALSNTWEQLYQLQGKKLAGAIEQISEIWQLLCMAYEQLQEQETTLLTAHQQMQIEQRRHQEIIELIPDAYLVTNAYGMIQEANLLAARLLHRPQQFLLGKPLTLFVCEQERQAFYQQVKQLVEAELLSEHQEWTIRLLRPNRQQFEVALTVAANHDAVSKQITLHWFVHGAVAQKPDESGQLLEAVVQQIPEAVVITTANLDEPGPQVVFVNSAFTKMTGYSLEEMVGKTPRILQGKDTDRATLRQLRQTLEQERCFQGEAINYHKDGSKYRVHLHCAPIHNQRGEVTHYVSVQSHLKSA